MRGSWPERLNHQRRTLAALARQLASVEDDIARIFTDIAKTSPHRAKRLLGLAEASRKHAAQERAAADEYDRPSFP
jgi:hypothetical protein